MKTLEKTTLDKLESLAKHGIYPFYAPQVHDFTQDFEGYTAHVYIRYLAEKHSAPFETIEEALNHAIMWAEKILKELEDKKPLLLF